MADPVITLFGAAGKTSRAVAAALRARGVEPARIRGLVRPGRASPRPDGVVVEADLENGDALTAAVAGSSVLYVLAPNLHPDEPGIVRRAIAAARARQVPRIVYHSVLRPGIRAMPHHWAKLAAEELLWESGLAVTVLQPCAYAQNLSACVRGTELVVPYSVRVPFSLVDLAEVAEVTARVLTEPGHDAAVYELAGPVTTVESVAGALGLRARRRPGPDPGVSYPEQALDAMFGWYDRHGLAGNPGPLQWLLGRPPRAAAEVLRDA